MEVEIIVPGKCPLKRNAKKTSKLQALKKFQPDVFNPCALICRFLLYANQLKYARKKTNKQKNKGEYKIALPNNRYVKVDGIHLSSKKFLSFTVAPITGV